MINNNRIYSFQDPANFAKLQKEWIVLLDSMNSVCVWVCECVFEWGGGGTELRVSDCERKWSFSSYLLCGAPCCACVQDFEMNGELKLSVICLLEEVLRDPDLLPQERKATANILRCPTCGKRSGHEWMFTSCIVLHFCLSLFTLLPSFHSLFFIVISYFLLLFLHSDGVFLSQLFSSVPVPFLKMSRTTPSWGSRTSCRWWATFP